MGCKDVGAFADSGYFQSSKVGNSKYKPITKMWLAFLFLCLKELVNNLSVG